MNAESLYARYLDPPWSKPARREREFLEAGEALILETEFGPVQGRRWRAQSEPRGQILLAHGWAGRSATWLVLAPMLTARGLDAIAYDAPGHGESRPSPEDGRSHFFALAATLLAAGNAHGPFAGVLGHSFGASVLPFALNAGLAAERAVLVAPNARTASYLSRWATAEGLTPAEETAVETLWIEEFGAGRLDDVDTLAQAGRRTEPALVLHDVGDTEIPVTDGETVATTWPDAVFEPTTGLGHRRILLSRPAMARAAAFLAGEPV